jgi:hypothetical protein
MMALEDNLEFFQEGLRSYMDAMLALGQFRQEVKKRAERVLTSNLPELQRALGITLQHERQEIYVYPTSPTNFSATSVWITTRLLAPQFQLVLFGLRWREIDGETVLFVVGGFWFGSAAVRERARQAFGGDNELSDDDGGLYLQERLTPEEAASFEGKLENIIRKWIELWRRAGSLSAVVGGTDQH